MVQLYNKYKHRNFNILAFPCNQFANQEPGNPKEIREFVARFKPEFWFAEKIDINGDKTHPAYKFLKTCFPGDVTWNFASQFIIDSKGTPIRRYEKTGWDVIEKGIVELLDERDAAAKKGEVAVAASNGDKNAQPASPAAAPAK